MKEKNIQNLMISLWSKLQSEWSYYIDITESTNFSCYESKRLTCFLVGQGNSRWHPWWNQIISATFGVLNQQSLVNIQNLIIM
jgi:hypothetical protein